MSFFAELKRRNVIRMAGLYLVGAWAAGDHRAEGYEPTEGGVECRSAGATH
jgi:hypothetical protein